MSQGNSSNDGPPAEAHDAERIPKKTEFFVTSDGVPDQSLGANTYLIERSSSSTKAELSVLTIWVNEQELLSTVVLTIQTRTASELNQTINQVAQEVLSVTVAVASGIEPESLQALEFNALTSFVKHFPKERKACHDTPNV